MNFRTKQEQITKIHTLYQKIYELVVIFSFSTEKILYGRLVAYCRTGPHLSVKMSWDDFISYPCGRLITIKLKRKIGFIPHWLNVFFQGTNIFFTQEQKFLSDNYYLMVMFARIIIMCHVRNCFCYSSKNGRKKNLTSGFRSYGTIGYTYEYINYMGRYRQWSIDFSLFGIRMMISYTYFSSRQSSHCLMFVSTASLLRISSLAPSVFDMLAYSVRTEKKKDFVFSCWVCSGINLPSPFQVFQRIYMYGVPISLLPLNLTYTIEVYNNNAFFHDFDITEGGGRIFSVL